MQVVCCFFFWYFCITDNLGGFLLYPRHLFIMFGDSEVYLSFLFKLFYLHCLVLASRSWPSFLWFQWGFNCRELALLFWSALLLLGLLLVPIVAAWGDGRCVPRKMCPHGRSNCKRGESQASNDTWLLGPHAPCGRVPLDDAACQPQISWRRWYIPGSQGFLLVGLPVHPLHQWCQEADFRGVPFLPTELGCFLLFCWSSESTVLVHPLLGWSTKHSAAVLLF